VGETQGPCYLPLREFRPLHFSAWYHMVGGPNRWNALGGAARRIAHLGAAFEVEEGVSSNETGPRLARKFDAILQPNSSSVTFLQRE